MSEYRVILDKILIRKIEDEEEQVVNGIIMPNPRAPFISGIVLAVGNDVKEVMIGDEVTIHSYAGTWVKCDEEERTVICDRDVLTLKRATLCDGDVVTLTSPIDSK